MKIGIISDTHGNIEGGRLAVRRLLQNGANVILHLGDGVADAIEIERLEGFPIQRIAGNNDIYSGAAFEGHFSYNGHCILAVHGHREDMNRYHGEDSRLKSLNRLASRAKALGASIVLFGHTHHAEDFIHSGIRFVNPGSLDLGASQPSCCIINLEHDEPTIEFLRWR